MEDTRNLARYLTESMAATSMTPASSCMGAERIAGNVADQLPIMIIVHRSCRV